MLRFNAAGIDFNGEISERHVPKTRRIALSSGGDAREFCAVDICEDFNALDGTCFRD